MKRIRILLGLLLLTLFYNTGYAQTSISVSQPKLNNKAIQDLKVIVTDDTSRLLRVDFVLIDYMERSINHTSVEKKSSPKHPIEFDGYTKIVDAPYQVRVTVTDVATAKILDEVRVPIENGYYPEKIQSVEELKYQVAQFSNYVLPKTAKATLNNGKAVDVNLNFNGAVLDTSALGIKKLPVVVTNDKYKYSEQLEATFEIVAGKPIASIPGILKNLRKGEAYALPEMVEVIYSDETRGKLPVVWSGTFDKDVVKKYELEGTVKGTDIKAKLTVNVVDFDANAKYIFIDEIVKEYVSEQLKKSAEEITYADLLTINDLVINWTYTDINLSDIAEMKNLTKLDLSQNAITSIEPLRTLTKLEDLNLFSNSLSNIDTLGDITSLKSLSIGSNSKINDISALKYLTKLEKLNLNSTAVTDIKALRYTDKLKDLSLPNTIKDLTPIAKYNTNLKTPFDIKLLETDGDELLIEAKVGQGYFLPYSVLHNGNIVFVDWESESGVVQPQLEVRGFTDSTTLYARFTASGDSDKDVVVFKDKTLEQIIRYSVDKPYGDILVEDVKNLRILDLAFKPITDLSGLEHLKGLHKLGLYGIKVSDADLRIINTMTELKWLDLGSTSLTQITKNTFNNLTNLIELVVDDNPQLQIEKGAFVANTLLEDFLADNANLYNLDCLKGAKNLNSVFARENKITSIEGLRDLDNLDYISLANNRIADLSPLAGKAKITHLMMNNNPITNISVIADMPLLDTIYFKDCLISNVDAVKDLNLLQVVYLDNNKISSVEAFRNHTEITQLTLKNNKVTSVEPLSTLTKIRVLHLFGNPITDIKTLDPIIGQLKNKDF